MGTVGTALLLFVILSVIGIPTLTLICYAAAKFILR